MVRPCSVVNKLAKALWRTLTTSCCSTEGQEPPELHQWCESEREQLAREKLVFFPFVSSRRGARISAARTSNYMMRREGSKKAKCDVGILCPSDLPQVT